MPQILPDVGDVLARVWADLVARPDGPLSFRFILQPVMSCVLGIRDGISDARTGRSPYFWTVWHDPARRTARLHEGISATARVILLGLAMDVIYQLWVLRIFYPVEALLVAVALAFIPYVFIRGPAARVARWWFGRTSQSNAHLRKQP